MGDRNWKRLYPPFNEKLQKVIAEMNEWCDKHLKGFAFRMTDGYRSLDEQKRLYAIGRGKDKGHRSIVTKADGVKVESNHQSSMAADCAPFCLATGKVDYDVPSEAWSYYAHLARKHGLKDGRSFGDNPHVQWPIEDKEAYKEAREWQKTQDLR